MANDFSTDGNCKALWNLESGALITDSKGTNTLVNVGVDEDLIDFKQGSCSGAFVRANTDRMYITDANLDPGFPLKSGESNKTFSFTFWVKLDQINIYHYLVQKTAASPNRCFIVDVNNTNHVRLAISRWGFNYTLYVHASTVQAGRWYHIGITYYNVPAREYRIRIWDDTAGSILGVDGTGLPIDINISATPFTLSDSANSLDGNLDEVVVFDDVLSVAEIDQIRSGTYGAAPPPAVGKFGSLISKEVIEQETGVFAEI